MAAIVGSQISLESQDTQSNHESFHNNSDLRMTTGRGSTRSTTIFTNPDAAFTMPRLGEITVNLYEPMSPDGITSASNNGRNYLTSSTVDITQIEGNAKANVFMEKVDELPMNSNSPKIVSELYIEKLKTAQLYGPDGNLLPLDVPPRKNIEDNRRLSRSTNNASTSEDNAQYYNSISTLQNDRDPAIEASKPANVQEGMVDEVTNTSTKNTFASTNIYRKNSYSKSRDFTPTSENGRLVVSQVRNGSSESWENKSESQMEEFNQSDHKKEGVKKSPSFGSDSQIDTLYQNELYHHLNSANGNERSMDEKRKTGNAANAENLNVRHASNTSHAEQDNTTEQQFTSKHTHSFNTDDLERQDLPLTGEAKEEMASIRTKKNYVATRISPKKVIPARQISLPDLNHNTRNVYYEYSNQSPAVIVDSHQGQIKDVAPPRSNVQIKPRQPRQSQRSVEIDDHSPSDIHQAQEFSHETLCNDAPRNTSTTNTFDNEREVHEKTPESLVSEDIAETLRITKEFKRTSLSSAAPLSSMHLEQLSDRDESTLTNEGEKYGERKINMAGESQKTQLTAGHNDTYDESFSPPAHAYENVTQDLWPEASEQHNRKPSFQSSRNQHEKYYRPEPHGQAPKSRSIEEHYMHHDEPRRADQIPSPADNHYESWKNVKLGPSWEDILPEGATSTARIRKAPLESADETQMTRDTNTKVRPLLRDVLPKRSPVNDRKKHDRELLHEYIHYRDMKSRPIREDILPERVLLQPASMGKETGHESPVDRIKISAITKRGRILSPPEGKSSLLSLDEDHESPIEDIHYEDIQLRPSLEDTSWEDKRTPLSSVRIRKENGRESPVKQKTYANDQQFMQPSKSFTNDESRKRSAKKPKQDHAKLHTSRPIRKHSSLERAPLSSLQLKKLKSRESPDEHIHNDDINYDPRWDEILPEKISSSSLSSVRIRKDKHNESLLPNQMHDENTKLQPSWEDNSPRRTPLSSVRIRKENGREIPLEHMHYTNSRQLGQPSKQIENNESGSRPVAKPKQDHSNLRTSQSLRDVNHLNADEMVSQNHIVVVSPLGSKLTNARVTQSPLELEDPLTGIISGVKRSVSVTEYYLSNISNDQDYQMDRISVYSPQTNHRIGVINNSHLSPIEYSMTPRGQTPVDRQINVSRVQSTVPSVDYNTSYENRLKIVSLSPNAGVMIGRSYGNNRNFFDIEDAPQGRMSVSGFPRQDTIVGPRLVLQSSLQNDIAFQLDLVNLTEIKAMNRILPRSQSIDRHIYNTTPQGTTSEPRYILHGVSDSLPRKHNKKKRTKSQVLDSVDGDHVAFQSNLVLSPKRKMKRPDSSVSNDGREVYTYESIQPMVNAGMRNDRIVEQKTRVNKPGRVKRESYSTYEEPTRNVSDKHRHERECRHQPQMNSEVREKAAPKSHSRRTQREHYQEEILETQPLVDRFERQKYNPQKSENYRNTLNSEVSTEAKKQFKSPQTKLQNTQPSRVEIYTSTRRESDEPVLRRSAEVTSAAPRLTKALSQVEHVSDDEHDRNMNLEMTELSKLLKTSPPTRMRSEGNIIFPSRGLFHDVKDVRSNHSITDGTPNVLPPERHHRENAIRPARHAPENRFSSPRKSLTEKARQIKNKHDPDPHQIPENVLRNMSRDIQDIEISDDHRPAQRVSVSRRGRSSVDDVNNNKTYASPQPNKKKNISGEPSSVRESFAIEPEVCKSSHEAQRGDVILSSIQRHSSLLPSYTSQLSGSTDIRRASIEDDLIGNDDGK